MEAHTDAAAHATLAIDLGTKTGWAFNPSPGVILSGTWDLSPKKGETEGERYRRFTAELDAFYSQRMDRQGSLIVYEDVKRHRGTRAAHVHGGLLATLKIWCLTRGLAAPIGVGVKQIKKFWTGNGNAVKAQMIIEARCRHYDPIDDNEADALALLHLILTEGPPVAKTKPKKRKAKAEAKTAVTGQARRPVARRAAGRLRASDRRLSEKGVSEPGSTDQNTQSA